MKVLLDKIFVYVKSNLSFLTYVRFWQNRKGLAALEFAMIVPLMIAMYMGAVELGQALTVDRKLTSLASASADLVAQSKQVSQSDIDDIFEITDTILSPYDTASLKIIISSVVSDQNNVKTVDWSVSNQTGQAYSPGATIPGLPANITEPNSSIIVTEVEYNYSSPVNYYFTGSITLSDMFFTRPRQSLQVEFTN